MRQKWTQTNTAVSTPGHWLALCPDWKMPLILVNHFITHYFISVLFSFAPVDIAMTTRDFEAGLAMALPGG